MIRAAVVPNFSDLARIQRAFDRQMEQRLLDESDRAAAEALADMRREMERAGLGRLGYGLGYTSDKKKGKGVHRSGRRVSASGVIFIRSGSERTRGAIESYTAGADIRPKKGRYLWIPTDDIPARVGRQRITPELYNRSQLVSRIGPLVRVTAANGTPLLIVRNVGVSASGAPRSARSLTKRGMPRKGQIGVDYIVAFFGIEGTKRVARVNPRAIAAARAQHMARRLGTGSRTQVLA